MHFWNTEWKTTFRSFHRGYRLTVFQKGRGGDNKKIKRKVSDSRGQNSSAKSWKTWIWKANWWTAARNEGTAFKKTGCCSFDCGGGPARGSLEQLAKELGIERSVRFAGMVNPNEVADYYKLGDILHVRRQARHRGWLILRRWQADFRLCAERTLVFTECWRKAETDILMNQSNNLCPVYKDFWKKRKYLKMRDSTAGKSQKSMEQNDLESVWKAAMKSIIGKRVWENESAVICEESTGRLKSGVGRAMVMQEESLKGNGVEVTTDPKMITM